MHTLSERYHFTTGEVAIMDPQSNGAYLVPNGFDSVSLDEAREMGTAGTARFVDATALDRMSRELATVEILG